MAGLGFLLTISACKNDDPDPVEMYEQEDQMARPAINTVFVKTGEKDLFNQTIPSLGASTWGSKFNTQLLALNAGYTTIYWG